MGSSPTGIANLEDYLFTKKDQEKKEYEEWKKKYGHDWKTEKEIKEEGETNGRRTINNRNVSKEYR